MNVKQATYNPTKAELAAIRKGAAAITRGEYVSLAEFLQVPAKDQASERLFASYIQDLLKT